MALPFEQSQTSVSAALSSIVNSHPMLRTAIGPADRFILLGQGSAKVFSVRGDTNAPQVQPVCIPASHKRRVAPRNPVAVPVGGELQQIHLIVSRIKIPTFEPPGQRRPAGTMAVIGALVQTAGILEKCKQLNHMMVGLGIVRRHQSISPHPRPMRNAVVDIPVNYKLTPQVVE